MWSAGQQISYLLILYAETSLKHCEWAKTTCIMY